MPNIRACIYVLVAIYAGYMLCTYVFRHHRQDIKNMAIGWAVITVLIFLIPSPPVYFLLMGLILFKIAPKDRDKRFQFYCAVLPAIPMIFLWRISFLGIETVMMFDHVKLISIAILLPLFFEPKSKQSFQPSQAHVRQSYRLFKLFLVYLIVTLILELRGSNATSMVRMCVETFLNPIIFLVVANRMCRDRQMLNAVLLAMLVSGVFIALISCVEQFTKWKLYNEVSGRFVLWKTAAQVVRDIRWGMMRTPTTLGPIPLGYFMSLCIVISIYFSGLKKRGDQQYGGSILITMLCFAGLIFSGSRGAWIIAAVMLGFLKFFDDGFKPLRGIVTVAGVLAIFSFPAIMNYLAQSDPYGTFRYRMDLFTNSLIVIKDNFMFGDLDFRSHPALEASRQGQGIIDVVNVYLGVALRYGVPVLMLLLFIIVSVIKGLLKVRAKEEALEVGSDYEWQARIVLVMILGGITMVATVSFVDRISHYLWLTLVFGMCFLGLEKGAGDKGLDIKKSS